MTLIVGLSLPDDLSLLVCLVRVKPQNLPCPLLEMRQKRPNIKRRLRTSLQVTIFARKFLENKFRIEIFFEINGLNSRISAGYWIAYGSFEMSLLHVVGW